MNDNHSPFSEKKIRIIALIVILSIGLYSRLYHIDYPPIGYHSMKEVHYLSVAKGYLDYGDFLHKRVLYSGMSEGPGYLEAFPQFPLLSLIFFFLWKIFGVKIWIARLVIVIFSMGATALTYSVCRQLSDDEEVSLLAALFMAIMPLSIFFGRNIQPDIAALFFVLLFTFYYLKWLDNFKARYLFYSSMFVFLTAITKGTFLFLLIPLVFLFPYYKLADKNIRRILFKQSIWVTLGPVLILTWLIFTKSTQVYSKNMFPGGRLFLDEAFTLSYWRPLLPLIWKYIGENYTYFYFGLFVVGLSLGVSSFKSRLSKYIIGTFASAILYFIFLSDYTVQHSYYHIPFLPMVCFGIATASSTASSIMEFKRARYVKYLIILLIIIFPLYSVKASLDKNFNILMLGSDVAGKYIKEHGLNSDRIFISYGSPSDRGYEALRTQFYGTLWEAGKRGSILPADLEKIKFGENERNMRWILLYKTVWFEEDKDILQYIYGNYSIRQIGYKENKILYYLLNKGGKFNISDFDKLESRFARIYEYSDGQVDLYVKEQ